MIASARSPERSRRSTAARVRQAARGRRLAENRTPAASRRQSQSVAAGSPGRVGRGCCGRQSPSPPRNVASQKASLTTAVRGSSPASSAAFNGRPHQRNADHVEEGRRHPRRTDARAGTTVGVEDGNRHVHRREHRRRFKRAGTFAPRLHFTKGHFDHWRRPGRVVLPDHHRAARCPESHRPHQDRVDHRKDGGGGAAGD